MIIVRLSGGMGNQMFQYALGRALALKYNVPLKLDIDMQMYLHEHGFNLKSLIFRPYSLDVFNISVQIANQKEVPWYLRNYGAGKVRPIIDGVRRRILHPSFGKRDQQYDPAILLKGPNTYLDGNWQTPKYFSDIKDVLQKDFTLKEPLSEKSQSLHNEIVSCNAVCVHIRRGDYVGNKVHDTAIGQTYYDKGISYISNHTTIEKIYVFSDDIEWCRANLTFAYPTIFVGNEYAGDRDCEHFALMSACKYFVIPNSTFSWWAAWLAANENKIVIAPKKWFADDTIDTHDLIPEEWVRM